MQQAPARLTQTIWSAFRASRPLHRSRLLPQSAHQRPERPELWLRREPLPRRQVRFYSDKSQDVERKVEEASNRIKEALDSRVQAASPSDTQLKQPQDETIVHTNPESSSIVHSHTDAAQRPSSTPSSRKSPDPLPSEKPSHTSPIRQRFSSFMDNFQSHLFTASQRLNDLTGYSGIEALKNDITAQEDFVASSRLNVNDAREKYAAAIATRSATQREVNDLLQRKHTWSPTDLERFTSLYRSDHANEQAETASQKAAQDAETKYEEASTRLARTILARYHEEQIWSDKIRQMSTWGTWGLMGLNVLLFVVFQILIEPWRRKRLVKGFEEKVEVALRERDEETRDMIRSGGSAGRGLVSPNGNDAVLSLSEAKQANPVEAGKKVDGIADHIAGQIVDAISGSSPTLATPPQAVSTSSNPTDEAEAISGTTPTTEFTTDQELHQQQPTPLQSAFAQTASNYASYQESFRELFSEREIVVTQRDMTTVALEGAVGGAAFMVLLLVLLRPR